MLTIGAVGLLSSGGRSQAFSLGESFFQRYGFTLLKHGHIYTVEFAGNSL